MASEKCWLAIGLSLLMLSLIIYVVGFSSPYWLEKFDEIDTPLENLGLWQICFGQDGMVLNTKEQEAKGMVYTNCYWIFHPDMKLASDVTAKSFFVWTQLLSTLSLTLMLIIVLMLMIRLCGCCLNEAKAYVAKITAFLSIVAVMLMIIGLIVFGLKTGHEDWIVHRNHVHLSWGFGLCGGAAFVLIFAALFLALAAFAVADDLKAKAKAKHYALHARRY